MSLMLVIPLHIIA